MEARAIQIYKPVNKNEVRLVYRIKNSIVSGENGRHQKSYSFNKYGEQNAWNMARDAFKYINTNNKLPFDFNDPWRMKLINKRGKKSQNIINKQLNNNTADYLIFSEDSMTSNFNKRSSSMKDETNNMELRNNLTKTGNISKLSIANKYNYLDDQYEVNLGSYNSSKSVSPDFSFKSEKGYSDFDDKEGKNEIGSSYLYLLATAATEIIEEEENKKISEVFYNKVIVDNSIDKNPVKTKNSTFTDANKVFINTEIHPNIINKPSFNIPLIFNNQNNQYATALFNSINHLMIMEPSFTYLNNFQIPK